eukprot:119477_1
MAPSRQFLNHKSYIISIVLIIQTNHNNRTTKQSHNHTKTHNKDNIILHVMEKNVAMELYFWYRNKIIETKLVSEIETELVSETETKMNLLWHVNILKDFMTYDPANYIV